MLVLGIGLIAGGFRFPGTKLGIDKKQKYCFYMMAVMFVAQAFTTQVLDSSGTADSRTGSVMLKISRGVSRVPIPLPGLALTSDNQGSMTLLLSTIFLLCALHS